MMKQKITLMRKADHLRQQLGLTKAAICDEMGVKSSYYTNWMKRGLPLSRLDAMAMALDTTANELLKGIGGESHVIYQHVPIEAWMRARSGDNDDFRAMFFTYNHSSWIFAELNSELQTANVCTREVTDYDFLRTWIQNHGSASSYCIQLTLGQMNMLRNQRVTAVEIFGENAWYQKIKLLLTLFPYSSLLRDRLESAGQKHRSTLEPGATDRTKSSRETSDVPTKADKALQIMGLMQSTGFPWMSAVLALVDQAYAGKIDPYQEAAQLRVIRTYIENEWLRKHAEDIDRKDDLLAPGATLDDLSLKVQEGRQKMNDMVDAERSKSEDDDQEQEQSKSA